MAEEFKSNMTRQAAMLITAAPAPWQQLPMNGKREPFCWWCGSFGFGHYADCPIAIARQVVAATDTAAAKLDPKDAGWLKAMPREAIGGR